MKVIKKELLEVHKPSAMITAEYSRVVKRNGKIVGELNNLLPVQHDAMNFLCYNAREQIHKKIDVSKILTAFDTENELMEFLQVQEFSVNINEFVEFIEGYQLKQDKKYLFNQIDDMQRIQARVGIFKTDSICGDLHGIKTMSLIRNYTRMKNSNIFSFQLEPEILLGWIHNPKPYTKLFLKVQTKLKLTYSKILYEICKDYEKLKSISKPFDEWVKVLGIDKSKTNTGTPGQLKAAYLKKAIKEINTHTDIFIDNIKGKKVDGDTNMIIEYHKQDCSLIDDFKKCSNLTIEQEILLNKKTVIAKERLLLSQQVQTIVDEEAWINKTINSISDEFIETQDLIQEAKSAIDEIDIKDFSEMLQKQYKDYIGMKDYKLYYLFDETKPHITNSALETYRVLEELE